MSYNISELEKESYHHSVNLAVQQRGSVLSDCVRFETQETERKYYDRLQQTSVTDYTPGEENNTKFTKTKAQRRVLSLIQSDWADLIDSQDKLKFSLDPTSLYTLNAAYALGRRKDKHIIDALIGEAYGGPKGNDNFIFHEHHIIYPVISSESPQSGKFITLEQLRSAREKLTEEYLDPKEQFFCILSSDHLENLLRSQEVASSDYNSVKALVNGNVDTFLGFNFKVVPKSLLTDAGGAICYAKSGILMATKGDIKTEVSIRADKRMATQVYASMLCGAVRLDEQKVVLLKDEVK